MIRGYSFILAVLFTLAVALPLAHCNPRSASASLCVSAQKKYNLGACTHSDYSKCEDAFDAHMESLEVSGPKERVPFLERCCHVWSRSKAAVNVRDPFSKKRCMLMPKKKKMGKEGKSVSKKDAKVATKMCVAAQARWRKKACKSGKYAVCEDKFDAELEKMEIDNARLKPMLERCCHVWSGKIVKSAPFSPRRCIEMPKSGVDVTGATAAGKVVRKSKGGKKRTRASPAVIKAAKLKVKTLKNRLAQLVARHRECHLICKKKCGGASGKCHKVCKRKCCKVKAKKRGAGLSIARRKTTSRRVVVRSDVHLIHRAIVAWVTRMIKSTEDAVDPQGVPYVVEAMTRMMCRKIQLKFNPSTCASGKNKCGIKFRDAIGVLRFPLGPRGPRSPYARFIVGKSGKNVPWCSFEWNEREAGQIAKKLAEKKLRDSLRKRALARARAQASSAAAAERDQEDGAMRAKMDPEDFVVLAPGAKGPDAVALRFLLRSKGMFTGVAKGSYAAAAVKAVEKFQQREKLQDNGVVDGNTWVRFLRGVTIRKWKKNSSEAVKAVQYLLKFKYGRKVKVCGVYNRETAATIKLMQKQHGIPQTSIVGPREWPMLLADLDGPPKKMSAGKCHKKMGLVLGAERAKSGRDCLETEIYAMECCQIRARFNCEKRSKEKLGEMLKLCFKKNAEMKQKAKKRAAKVKKRALEQKAASHEEMVQKCGPCAFRTLHLGSRGPEVAALRYLLQEWEVVGKMPKGSVERFGNTLTGVVKTFQKSKGMIPDGTVGPQSWLRLIDGEFLWRRSRFDRAIRGLQYLLRRKFSAKRVKITGKYDKETERAVSAFQRAEGLKADGMVGGHTWSALLAAKGSRNERRAVRNEAAKLQGLAHLEFVTLSRGDEGASVAALKYLLKEHGLMATNDDKFDGATASVVAKYRGKAGLSTGSKRCGPKMWMSLISAGPMVAKGVNRPNAVRAVQFVLKHRYGVAVPVTGRYDAGTERAVREFQIGNMLREDGKVGPVTWQRLLPAEDEPDVADTIPKKRTRLRHGAKFMAVQTESEIEREVSGLVSAVSQNLSTKDAAREVCTALQNKFNSPNKSAHRPGCLDGKLHCAEGFYLAMGAIKKLTDLGPALSGCKHVYES